MQETKLKIDFNQGLLEVEGSEDLVREIYNDFKEALKARPQSAFGASEVHGSVRSEDQTSAKASSSPKDKAKSKANSKPKSKKASDTTGTLIKDLNLMNDGSTESLRDFYAKYDVKTNLERTLVFVYYLQHVRACLT